MLRSVSLLVLLVLPGCAAHDRPELAPVSGTVYYGSQPLAGARVVFSPVGGGHKAHATTDAAGNFQLSTFEPGDGAIVGEHVVTVVKRGPRKLPPEGTPGRGLPGGPSEPGDPLIPERYFSDATSDLSAQVVAGGLNEIDITLPDD